MTPDVFVKRTRNGAVEYALVRFRHRDEGHAAVVRRLLGDGADNLKLSKAAPGGRHRTFHLSLAPAKESGFQVCPKSTPGCRAACIHTSGYGFFPSVAVGRVARTLLWFLARGTFEEMLRRDLGRAVKVCRWTGRVPAVRLNAFSDLPWERLTPWAFEDFPEIQYYDYTKIFGRTSGLPANYDLTFSLSESNHAEAARVLAAGGRVAAVFGVKPGRWEGGRPESLTIGGRKYPVTDGERHDLRFLDPPGVVGLLAKGKGRADRTGFVLRPGPDGRFNTRQRVPLATVISG